MDASTVCCLHSHRVPSHDWARKASASVAAHDRRAKLVRLTPRGREAVLVAREAIAATEPRWARELGKKRMADLRELLQELCAFVDGDEADA